MKKDYSPDPWENPWRHDERGIWQVNQGDNLYMDKDQLNKAFEALKGEVEEVIKKEADANGDWKWSTSNPQICPECGACVPGFNKETHEQWHRDMELRIILEVEKEIRKREDENGV